MVNRNTTQEIRVYILVYIEGNTCLYGTRKHNGFNVLNLKHRVCTYI